MSADTTSSKTEELRAELRKAKARLVLAVLELAGLAAVITGVQQVNQPAAWIIGGLTAVAIAERQVK